MTMGRKEIQRARLRPLSPRGGRAVQFSESCLLEGWLTHPASPCLRRGRHPSQEGNYPRSRRESPLLRRGAPQGRGGFASSLVGIFVENLTALRFSGGEGFRITEIAFPSHGLPFPDRAGCAPGGRGATTRTVVPRPGVESTSRRPSRASARSEIPSSP